MAAHVRFGHVAVPARDPRTLAAFYGDFLGLDIALEGTLPALGEFVFLSDHPGEMPVTLALMTNPEARHIAWEVESFDALKAFHAEALARGIPVDFTFDHGVSLSLYLRDPEGNSVEVYWPTGQQADEPFARPIDLATMASPTSGPVISG